MNPLQTRIDSIEERLARIEKILEGNLSGKRNDIERLLIDKIDKISVQHLVIISLYLTPNQTRQNISDVIADWGKDVSKWFEKNHFDALIKKKLIKKQGGKNDARYSLTGKGKTIADKTIEQLISGKNLQLQKFTA